ncbi:hypothetical protein P3H15_54760, partial [Rhodococcus sp. T2V]|uniref:hypothetical protein n=1 Tax=Rhodococcus sp. T2V TaxID=3034164 RepID=UPI0023E15DF0
PVDLDLLAEASEQARRELGGGFIRLVDVDGHPHQILGTTAAKPVPVLDFRDDSVKAAGAWMRDESAAPIDMYGESLTVSHILHLADGVVRQCQPRGDGIEIAHQTRSK